MFELESLKQNHLILNDLMKTHVDKLDGNINPMNIISLNACLITVIKCLESNDINNNLKENITKLEKVISSSKLDLDFLKRFNFDLGLEKVENEVVQADDYEDVKQVQLQGENLIVSFEDGGVIALLEKDGVSSLINTVQCKNFKDDYMNELDKEPIKNKLQNLFSEKSTISKVAKDLDNDYKQYTLSNGLDIKLNTHGVLVDDKEYYTFEDFIKEYKDKLNEDAYYEFNKYCVKQDTGDRLINPFNLDVNDINIDDIVTALSGINRFAGQTKKLQSDFSEGDNFYTVGQHTLAMYDAIKNKPSVVGLEHVSDMERNKLAKMALVHESFEGITGTDLITPFKYATKKNEYKIAEVEAEAVMEKIFDMPLMNSELKRIDKAMAATEGTYLVGKKNVDWSSYGNILDKSVLKTGMSQKEVCEQLKEKFEVEGLVQKVEDYKAKFNSNLNPYSTDVIFKAKYEKLQSVLNEVGNYNEKALSLVSKQRINCVENNGNEVTLILENGNNLYVSANEVYLENNSRKINVDLDDFMINQKFSDLTRLDYFENEGANNQLMEFEKSFGTKINNDEIKVGL